MICLFQVNLIAQDTLSMENFMKSVLSNHPVVKQADNLDLLTESQKLAARAAMDPKISSNLYRKELKEQLYFDQRDFKLTLPTKFGFDIEGLYKVNDGDFINNSATLPDLGLASTGISVPVLRGLLYNERQRSLQEAEIFKDLNENEQRILFNEILKKASYAYLSWQNAFEIFLITQQGVELARQNKTFAVESFIVGDLAAVDTLEADVNLQSRLITNTDAEMRYLMAKLNVNAFLWNDLGEEIYLSESAQPEAINTDVFPLIGMDSQETIVENHPKITKLKLGKQKSIIDRKLAIENLKPRLDLKYYPHYEVLESNELTSFSTNSYTLGLDFEFPLLNRKFRAQKKLYDFQIKNYEFKITEEERSIRILLQQLSLGRLNLNTQLVNVQTSLDGYDRLLNAERIKLSNGESNLFIVNQREIKFLELQLKRVDVRTKLAKNQIENYFGLYRLENSENINSIF